MANDVTVCRSFKPGEILVEVVSVGLYGLTAAEVPITPIAGLEASTVQGALEGINKNNADEVGIWYGKLIGATSGSSSYVDFTGEYARHGSLFLVSGSIYLANAVGTITGQLIIENTPVIPKVTTHGTMTFSKLPSTSRLLSATTAVGWNSNQARIFPIANSVTGAGINLTDIDSDTVIKFTILAAT